MYEQKLQKPKQINNKCSQYGFQLIFEQRHDYKENYR